jgi:hypothetical protein
MHTRNNLYPSTNHIDDRCIHEEEEQHATDADQYQECGESNEECSSFKGATQNRREIIKSSITDKILSRLK